MTWVMGSSKQMVSLHSAHIADMRLHSRRTGDNNIEKDGGKVTWLMKAGLQEDGAVRYIIDRKNETSSRSRREVGTWSTFEFTLSPRSPRDVLCNLQAYGSVPIRLTLNAVVCVANLQRLWIGSTWWQRKQRT